MRTRQPAHSWVWGDMGLLYLLLGSSPALAAAPEFLLTTLNFSSLGSAVWPQAHVPVPSL